MAVEPDRDPIAAVPPARRHRPLIWLLALVVVLAAAGTAWWFLGGSGDDPVEAATAVEFSEVVVTDMEAVTTLEGTLGFEAGDPVTSRLSGTLTGVPEAGEVLEEGDVLFEVDESPVVLMYGDLPAYQAMALTPDAEPLAVRASGTLTAVPIEDDSVIDSGDVIVEVDGAPVVALPGEIPMYRTLEYGRSPSEGADVRQLEEALVALGYDPDGAVTVDETFDFDTEQMVIDWQAAVGAAEDGSVGVGEVVFLPGLLADAGPATVAETQVAAGGQLGGNGVVATIYTTSTGSEGADVRELEEALLRLGFYPGDADGVYSGGTEYAVERWQESIGAEADGIVELGEVVFLPGPVRVAENTLVVGDEVRSGVQVFAATSDRVVVSVALPAADQDLLAAGDPVIVVLPDGTEAPATVTSVATVATRGAQGGDASFEVEVVLDDVTVAAGLDEAPVDVDVVTDSRPGVMAVPVTALLVLAEGGYAVEVDNGDGTTRLVAVDPGLYADGLVEVTADGLRPGDRVVAP
jgi:peptidoglycan hydrolase-like protein with peptidoglycan-binding domain